MSKRILRRAKQREQQHRRKWNVSAEGVHDNSNRGNNYRGIVMAIHHMEDNTNRGNDYRGNIVMATHHKEDIGNNSTLYVYYMKFKFYPRSPYKEKDIFHYNR